MTHSAILNKFELYIPKLEWYTILKVSIIYKEHHFFRVLAYLNVNWHKKYYIKVTHKDQKVRYIAISSDAKKEIKSNVTTFNFHLSTL